jgi:hypothetical protein
MTAMRTGGRGLVRRLGLLLALGLLALGLLAAPAGAAAAAPGASSPYYDPVIYTSRAVVSGEAIGVEGFNFYAHSDIFVQLFDEWGYERVAGGTVADWDGFFAGTISTYTLEPGFYTVVVSDAFGAVRYAVVEVVY